MRGFHRGSHYCWEGGGEKSNLEVGIKAIAGGKGGVRGPRKAENSDSCLLTRGLGESLLWLKKKKKLGYQ